MPEKRQFRVAARLPVVDAIEGEKRACYTKNLSLGGLFLLTDKRWPIGSTVSLSVNHEDARFDVDARVTHLQADGVGFSFVDASTTLREMLRQVIDKTISRPSDESDESVNRVAIQSRVVWAQDEQRYEADLRNIGQEGAFLETVVPPQLEGTVFVYLPAFGPAVTDNVPQELRGCMATVSRRDADGFAVRFVNPSAEFRMAVAELSRALARAPRRA